MPFIHALTETLKHEGGYSNHPADRGGATNFGITERVARSHGYQGDMKDIPIDTVRNIYRTSYWEKLKLDAVLTECGSGFGRAALRPEIDTDTEHDRI
jgi:lysozyme family protein